MKRLFALLLCVVLLCAFAFAESNSTKTDLLNRLAAAVPGLSTAELGLDCYYDEALDMLIFTMTDNTIDSSDWLRYNFELKEAHRSGVLTLAGQLIESLKAFGYSETHVVSLFTLSDSSIQYVFIDEIAIIDPLS